MKVDFRSQLRQEYGYDIDPNQPQFAQRLEEKEKEYSKMMKEEKKAKKAERRAKYAEEAAAEEESEKAAESDEDKKD